MIDDLAEAAMDMNQAALKACSALALANEDIACESLHRANLKLARAIGEALGLRYQLVADHAVSKKQLAAASA